MTFPSFGISLDIELAPAIGVSLHFPHGDDKIYLFLPFTMLTFEAITYKEDAP